MCDIRVTVAQDNARSPSNAAATARCTFAPALTSLERLARSAGGHGIDRRIRVFNPHMKQGNREARTAASYLPPAVISIPASVSSARLT
jgi:hypothetical protein